ncbi:MAG: hypothetical protein M0R76_08240 [Proteobacteria bacterium]|nr:hypothetical protein [Pseudomonadota bacterium]
MPKPITHDKACVFLLVCAVAVAVAVSGVSQAQERQRRGHAQVALNAGAQLGRAFGQDATNGDFAASTRMGGILALPIWHWGAAHHWGPAVAYAHSAHERRDGTENTQYRRRHQRIDLLAQWHMDVRWFTTNAGAGVSFLIIDTQAFYRDAAGTQRVQIGGTDVAFVAGAGLGVELGRAVFRFRRRLALTAQLDWMRRHHQDELAAYGQLSVGLF